MRRLAATTFIVGLLVGVFVIRFVGSGSLLAKAAETCSARSLVGSYSYQIWDKFVPAGTPTVTAYVVDGGLMTFDGRGGVTFVAEGSFNGIQFGQENRSGSYSVQQNCMGSFTMNYTASPTCCTNHYDFVIVANGNELTIFQRDGGTVSSGSAIKQGNVDS